VAERRDFYDILGVARSADAKEIQRAYRKLARENHPDVNKEPGAEERFKEISEAYDVLSDRGTRNRYDRFGHDFRQIPEGVDPDQWAAAQRGAQQRARAGAGAAAGYGGSRGRRTTVGGNDFSEGFTVGGDFGDVDLEDLLGGFFSRTGGMGGMGGMGSPRRPRGPVQGVDQEAEIQLGVQEAFTGGRRRITLSAATGEERSYEVNIPAGVTDGQRIRLAGQGGQGTEGGAPGDLYLVVRLMPDARFRVEGRDIYVDLLVTPWEAALGAKVPAEGPGGPAKVTVPAGTSSGKRLRLRRRGLPNPNGTPGDMYAEVRIMVPPRVTGRERELFEELARVSDFDPRRQT
jgi:curved DNA-binding protein